MKIGLKDYPQSTEEETLRIRMMSVFKFSLLVSGES